QGFELRVLKGTIPQAAPPSSFPDTASYKTACSVGPTVRQAALVGPLPFLFCSEWGTTSTRPTTG
ncbi:MAG: hypothetical protein ACKN94_01520, partial [Pirellulaceae bacterium]